MTLADFTLPEVRAHGLAGSFFRGEDGRDYVKIALVGSKDSFVKRVRPEHMAQFKAEWDAFCDGRPLAIRPGIPLTDLPSIKEARAQDYIHKNVHNLDELAALNDGQCQSLGHGTLTDRKAARELVASRQAEAKTLSERKVQEASAAIGKTADPDEVDGIKAEVAELKNSVSQILELLQAKPKRGRPKKVEN
jgi:hypothetical protein